MKTYFRQGDTVFFTFLFPLVMLLIFSTAFSEQSFGPPGDEISAAQFYLPAMLAAGLLLSGLQLLMMGVIGSYLGRVYVETQDRPLYSLALMARGQRGDPA